MITPGDIYFVLFRHKWKIIILTALGLVAAAYYFFTQQPLYQSDAKLLIRYVSDSRPANPSDNNSRVTSLIDVAQNILSSEMEILGSLDLADMVATNIGPDKILAKYGGGNDFGHAASVVRSGLRVENEGASSVIGLTLHHADPDMVRPILAEVISDYQDIHVRVHKAIGMSDDSLSDETSKLRLEIRQTEDELRIAKTNAGIISLADAKKSYQDLASKIHTELFEARASLAAHQTSLQELAGASTNNNGTNSLTVPSDTLTSYKALCQRLGYLERRQNQYIQEGFTDENKLVKETRQESVAATKTKLEMEAQYPTLVEMGAGFGLPNSGPPGSELASAPAETSESVQAAALPLRIKELQAQFAEIQADAARLNDAEAKINDLERKKALQEQNYNTFVTMLEQARIDEALGPGRVSNIQVIQQPSPPYKDNKRFYKAVGMLAGAGLFLGLIWAFLVEFYLDRSIKRPADLKNKLRVPFFLSIPDLNHGANNRRMKPERAQLTFNGAQPAAAAAAGAPGGALQVAAPPINQALHPHYDALRDRLVGYFESINLTRKPKLVAVTSTSKGAGVSTIAAGLAASLSETGDGRVLLVDMNLENGAARQFVRGQPDCQLDDALASEKRNHALVQENLYVVSEASNADKLPRILPKRFAALVPKLRASDYDYIIFDMPPVSQTSVTTRLAGFMDTVMLIVESEKTDRDVVKQAHELLQQSKANVTTVLNKTRKYIPAYLQHDINADM